MRRNHIRKRVSIKENTESSVLVKRRQCTKATHNVPIHTPPPLQCRWCTGTVCSQVILVTQCARMDTNVFMHQTANVMLLTCDVSTRTFWMYVIVMATLGQPITRFISRLGTKQSREVIRHYRSFFQFKMCKPERLEQIGIFLLV